MLKVTEFTFAVSVFGFTLQHEANMTESPMKAFELLELMYKQAPPFKKKVDRKLVHIVDRGGSVPDLIEFVTGVVGEITQFKRKTCAEAAQQFVYRRLGWL
jgi:hypothetical protein